MKPICDWSPRALRAATYVLTFISAFIAAPTIAAVAAEWRVNLLRGSTTTETVRGSTQQAAWDACLARIPRTATTSATYTCQTPRYVATVTPDVTPPAPVDCVVSAWGEWTAGQWSACSSGTQTRTETRTRVVTTQPANGGAACPALSETRTATQTCTVTPPTGLLLKMAYDGTADAGWGAGNAYTVDTRNWTRSFLPNGGPQGQAAWHMNVLRGTGTGGQFNYGWRKSLGGGITWGSEIHYRVRFRFTEATNFRCQDWSDGTEPSGCIDKFVILNDGCSQRPARFIHSIESESGQFHHRIQIDGGANLADTRLYPKGVWQDVQVRVRYSSVAGRADGGYAIWVDNDDQSRPTAQVTTALNAYCGPDYFKFGGFQNHGTASDGVYQWQHADFEIGRSFAPWNR